MKRFIYSLISCFLSITFLENCRQADSFVIEGKVAGVEEGSIVQLALELSAAMATRPFVETRVENGRFVLQGGLEGPRYCRLQVIDGRKKYITHLMVENSEIAITAKAGEGSAWWEEFEVKGSSSDKLLREKIVFQEECRKALDNKQKEYFALVRKMKKNKTLDESDSLKMAKLQKEIPEAEEKWEVDRVRMAKEAISRDKESFWGPLLMIAINRGSFNLRSETNLELYQQFSVEAQESYYGHILKQILYPKEFEKRLPAFSGMDREGNIRTDRELWQGKKCVVIDCWASSCAPCRKHIPELKKLYADYADKGLEIIGVSVDRKEESWKKALDEEQMPWANLFDCEYDFYNKLKVYGIPLILLVDREGKIIARGGSELMKDLRGKVNELLIE